MVQLDTVKFLVVICLLLVTKSESIKDNCRRECLNTQLTPQCRICVQICEYEDGEKVTMTSCQTKQQIHEFSYSKKRFQWNEKQCLSQCCYSEDQTFTTDTITKCQKKVQELGSSKTINNLIKAVVIVFFIFAIPALCCYIFQFLIPQLRFKYRRWKNKLSSKPCNIQEVKKLNWTNVQNQQSGSQSGAIDNVDLNSQQICLICETPHPNCETYCEHKFHIQCFRYEIFGYNECPSCYQKKLTPSKIICQICNQKYALFDLKATKQQYQKIVHFKKVYCDNCIQNLFAAVGNSNTQNFFVEQIEN